MIGRVLEQHDHVVHLVHALVGPRIGFDKGAEQLGVLLIGAQMRVAHDAGGVGMAAHEVHAERRLMHGLVLAEELEELVRVVAKLGCERDAQEVECLLGRLCHQSPPWAGAVYVTVCPGSRSVYVT